MYLETLPYGFSTLPEEAQRYLYELYLYIQKTWEFEEATQQPLSSVDEIIKTTFGEEIFSLYDQWRECCRRWVVAEELLVVPDWQGLVLVYNWRHVSPPLLEPPVAQSEEAFWRAVQRWTGVRG